MAVEYANFSTNTNGYETWCTDGHEIAVHRVLAIAEYGVDAVVGSEVHHQNEVRWDNRHENLVPMGVEEHRQHHNLQRSEGDGEWRDEDTLRRLYHDEGKSMGDIADELDCDKQIVWHWFEKHDIERDRNAGAAANEAAWGDSPWRDEQKVRKAYDDNDSYTEIGDALGCSKTTAHRWVKKHGVDEAKTVETTTQQSTAVADD